MNSDSARASVIGLLHPGEMGAAVGRCLTDRGHTVLWASQGRSQQTASRAAAAGLTDARTPRKLAAAADVIISVCPPYAAMDTAWSVHGFTGRYLDANAISPGTAREVAELVTSNGGSYTDGGIIGPPPVSAGTTRLYLSGEAAAAIAALFAGTPMETRQARGGLTGASAVKMAYAAWTKGTAALLLSARALAAASGVDDTLLGEWALSQPSLAGQFDRSARSAMAKGWRWVGEMEEIAASMAAAGLPDGFHLAAAEVFRSCPRARSAEEADAAPAEVLAALTAQAAAGPW
jgi:3-hydroxyisobutyrate dehydrogenase-like beta-hydroxyacid dehydrogenase